MSNEMVPRNQDNDEISIPERFMGGSTYIRYRMEKNRNIFVNDVSGEEKTALLVRVSGVRAERIHFKDAELICASRDSFMSKDGVLCECCPNINDAPFMSPEENEAKYRESCEKQNIQTPPPWNKESKCGLRIVINWQEEFEKNEDGSYTWIVQPGTCYLSCGKSSFLALVNRKSGYLRELVTKGYGKISTVVTRIQVGVRMNEKMKTDYSYEVFALEGGYLDIAKKCVNYNEIVAMMGQEPQVTPQLSQTPQKPAELPQKHAQPIQRVETPTPAQTPQKTTPAPAVTQEKQPQASPVQDNQSNVVTKIKVKSLYASLPAEIQKVVMSVLQVETIEKIAEKDLKVALETLEMAHDEVKKQPDAPGPAQTGKKGPSW